MDRALAEHNPSLADPALAEPSQTLKESLGDIHPTLRSGGDLPPTSKHETEIARITLASVHGEVTSIRARMANGRISYRVDDETAWEFGYKISAWPKWSLQPLTLGQLINLINSARGGGEDGLVVHHWSTVTHLGGNPEQAARFVRVTSQFYLQLGGWYAEYFRERKRL